MCRDYCQRNGYDVAEVFLEMGESAKTADRTELQRLLLLCTNRASAIRAVVIYKLDRLSRNTDDYSQIRLLLKRYQVEIKSTSEHFENSPVGRFMENTIANVAQFDNDIRAERCAEGMRQAAREGRYVWGATLGYDNVKVLGKCTIAPNPILGPLIRRMFQEIAASKGPAEEVRKAMFERGLQTRAGKPVSKSTFYRMLQNPVYAGWIIKFGERHRGLFEPVVEEDVFQAVQAALNGKTKRHGQHLTDNPDFPLRRFVVDEGGRKLTGCWSQGRLKKYPYYRFRGLKSSYNRDEFETLFESHMERFAFDKDKLKKLAAYVRENLTKATLGRRKEVARLKTHIEALKTRQRILVDKNLAGILSDSVLRMQLDEVEKEMGETNALIVGADDPDENYEDALEFVREYLQNPGKVWKESSLRVKIQLQVFEFPSGLVFENGIFRTPEISFLFKEKDAFSASNSQQVHLTDKMSNQLCYISTDVDNISRRLGTELTRLATILKGKRDLGLV